MKKSTITKLSSRTLVLALVVVIGLGFIIAPMVQADRFEQQINDLKAQNNQKQGQVNALKVEAGNLQATIQALQSQINGLQSQIKANEAKNNDLKKQIIAAEEELARQKSLLGENIKVMYLEGDISTLEMLASSKTIGDYVDKQQYRNSVKDKITTTLAKVNALKAQLKTQKEEVERLISEQKQLRAQVSAQQAEQSRLLSLNREQQATVDKEIKSNFTRIAELKRQQAIENARLFGGTGGTVGGGGYPWGRAKCIHTGRVEGWCSNYDWAMNGQIYNWNMSGYGYRNCTDWVDYRVSVAGGNVPSGLGNANTWDDRAPGYGYKVGDEPRKGAAAVSNGGYYGHVMYVEAVNEDGTVVVSDYNRAGTGTYDVTTLSAAKAANLRYVYF